MKDQILVNIKAYEAKRKAKGITEDIDSTPALEALKKMEGYTVEGYHYEQDFNELEEYLVDAFINFNTLFAYINDDNELSMRITGLYIGVVERYT